MADVISHFHVTVHLVLLPVALIVVCCLKSPIGVKVVFNDACTSYIVHCTIYIVQCILYIVHCTLYIVHCTLYNIHCTLYIVLCILSSG